MELDVFESTIKGCSLCSEMLFKYGVSAKPVFSQFNESTKIMLVGQAPGITEYKNGSPFTGSAGRSIRDVFSRCGINKFDKFVYQTSITKCFPGRKDGSSVDRVPSSGEIKNCMPFMKKQISIVKPELIVCLGMLASKNILGLNDHTSKAEINGKLISKLKVRDVVGNIFHYERIPIIPMIHPSGAANGVRSMNKEENERSIFLLTKEIKKINFQIIYE